LDINNFITLKKKVNIYINLEYQVKDYNNNNIFTKIRQTKISKYIIIMKKSMVILLLFMATIGYSQDWKNNLEDAKKEATEQNKKILLVFSGSDWCGPCIKLDRNFWQSDVFKKESQKSWVLLKADFPKKKADLLSPELTENNEKLAEKYDREGNFPLVVLLDKTGKVLGEKGYLNISAEDYIQAIHSLEN